MIAAGDPTFDAAMDAHDKGHYQDAKKLFQECLEKPSLENVKDNILLWIADCDRLENQRTQRIISAAERRKRRIENKCVFLSINDASISKDPNQSTASSLMSVLMKNNLTACGDIDNAYTVVTVYTFIEPSTTSNGFYKAKGGGYVRYGKAMEDKLIGQWSVDCEATSADDMKDAERLVRNKLNFKLSCALHNLLNNITEESQNPLPNNLLAIKLSEGSDKEIKEGDIRIFMQAMTSYIIHSSDYTFTYALNDAATADMDSAAQKQAGIVDRDKRPPFHELDGFKLVLRITVNMDSDNTYRFEGSIDDFGGHTIRTARIGKKFIIKTLNSQDQELAAAIIATGLDLKKWEIGEEIGDAQLAYFSGLKGKLVRVMNNGIPGEIGNIEEYRLELMRNQGFDRFEANSWNYPSLYDLKKFYENREELNLYNTYWSNTISSRGKHKALDFGNGTEIELKDTNRKIAIPILVKDF